MPFSNLVNIYFKYFKNMSSLQFQNSLYRRLNFYTLKVALFLKLSLLLLKYAFTIILFHMACLSYTMIRVHV